MYIMNNIIKYFILYSWALAVIQVTALPLYSEVIEPAINDGVVSQENIDAESNEDFNNEETEMNRSKKSATTFCIEIKPGTPEYVPCQPVMMGVQPQMVYVSDNHTSIDSNSMNNTVIHRQSEVILPPEPPCPKDEIFLILPPQQVQPTVSMVQVPIVHQIPQPSQILVATKPFLQTHFPELLNESNVQIHPLIPADESLPIANPQYPQWFQSSSNTFAMNKNDHWNMNVDLKEYTYPQTVVPSVSDIKLLEPSEGQGIGANLELGAEVRNQPPFLPPEFQNMGQNFANGAVTQHHSSFSGSLGNHEAGASLEAGAEVQNELPPFLQPTQYQHMGQNFANGALPPYRPSVGMGQNFGYGVEVQHQQPSMINQQVSTFNKQIVPAQQHSLWFMNGHASGQTFANGGTGQLPIQESVKIQRPIYANDFQTQQGYFSNMNHVMGPDGKNYYLVSAMMNGSPQLCLQPEPLTNPLVDNIHQQSSTQHQNLSAPDPQQSSSPPSINKQSREIKDSQENLKNPGVQTTVAPIKSGLKSSQDFRGKGGSSSQLNHLKGSSSLSKGKVLGKGQNKDSKANEKLESRRGNKRETDISVNE